MMRCSSFIQFRRQVKIGDVCWKRILPVDMLLKNGALCSMGAPVEAILFETKTTLRQHR